MTVKKAAVICMIIFVVLACAGVIVYTQGIVPVEAVDGVADKELVAQIEDELSSYVSGQ